MGRHWYFMVTGFVPPYTIHRNNFITGIDISYIDWIFEPSPDALTVSKCCDSAHVLTKLKTRPAAPFPRSRADGESKNHHNNKRSRVAKRRKSRLRTIFNRQKKAKASRHNHSCLIMSPSTTDMEATEQELKWAAAIKQAAVADTEIDSDAVSDLVFLQHAIVAKDKVPKALKRIKRMQKFKQKYGIQKNASYEDAMRDIKAFEEAHPNFILALGGLETEKNTHVHVLSVDYAQFFARKMSCDEAFKVLMRGIFYYMEACQPNIAAMRAGFVFLANADRMGWRNFSPKAEEHCAALYSEAYPIRVNKMIMMNSSPILRVFYNICKVFLSKKIRQTVLFCGDHNKYLQESEYVAPILLPTQWGGTMDLDTLHKVVQNKLKERYKAEAGFKL